MVGVTGDEAVAADVVVGLHALDHMHGEGKPGHPRFPCELVGEVELGGGRVLNPSLGAEVVDRLDQEVRLLAAHQVDVTHRPARVARQGRRPDQACGAVAEQVAVMTEEKLSTGGN